MKTLLFIAIITFSINAKAQVNFSVTNYPTKNNNNTIITSGDFNNDGNLDLVIACLSGIDISLLLGDGNGGFGTDSTIISFPPDTCNLCWFTGGDFNNDGNLDLALAVEESQSQISENLIFSGDGTGNFLTADTFLLPFLYPLHPGFIYTDDFNNDGNLDLATVYKDSVDISLGDGAGNFNMHNDFYTGASGKLTSGDFNGDGNKDIAITNDPMDSVAILIGDGAGNFGTVTKYLTGSNPYSVCSNDFNGDGFDDIAVANSNSDNASVFLSKGASGTFFNAVNYIATPIIHFFPFSIVSDDFNLDGKPDLAVVNFHNTVFILLGTGTGTFGPTTYFTVHSGPWAIISADFNSDGKPDLATANHDSFDVGILINQSDSVGIFNINYDKNISVFPNPTTGEFFIETTATGVQTVQIFDLYGNLVLSQSINSENTIDVTGLSEGVYTVAVKCDAGIINKKLVIAR